MDEKNLSILITRLEIVQIKLEAQRRDHNGQVLNHDDIDEIQIVIHILSNLIKEPTHIWKRHQR